jgi:hypothetical protein
MTSIGLRLALVLAQAAGSAAFSPERAHVAAAAFSPK